MVRTYEIHKRGSQISGRRNSREIGYVAKIGLWNSYPGVIHFAVFGSVAISILTPFLPLQNPQRWYTTTYLMNSKRWLFPCLFRVFMIQISVNKQESVNGCSSSSAAPIAGALAGADSLVTTRIVIHVL